MASAVLLSVAIRAKANDDRPGAGLHRHLCKERASMKTRPGIVDDAARARAVTQTRQPSRRVTEAATLPRAATDMRACPRAKAPGGR
jgi:hypothetical protein